MFCPYCGTKTTTNDARFCYECGRDMRAGDTDAERGHDAAAGTGAGEQLRRQEWRAAFGGTSFASAVPMMQRTFAGNNAMRGMLSVAGLLALIVLAIPVVAVVALVGLVAGVALIGALLHLAPAILIGLLVYWVLSQRRCAPHPGR